MLRTLLAAVTTNGNGDPVDVQSRWAGGAKTGQLQINFSTGTGTVTIQGKLNKQGSNWGTVAVFTASALAEITLFPQMRAVVSGIGGGAAITAELYAE